MQYKIGSIVFGIHFCYNEMMGFLDSVYLAPDNVFGYTIKSIEIEKFLVIGQTTGHPLKEGEPLVAEITLNNSTNQKFNLRDPFLSYGKKDGRITVQDKDSKDVAIKEYRDLAVFVTESTRYITLVRGLYHVAKAHGLHKKMNVMKKSMEKDTQLLALIHETFKQQSPQYDYKIEKKETFPGLMIDTFVLSHVL